MPNYHPSIDMLTDYSAGALALPHALCVSAHLNFCAKCRSQVAKLNLVGAELFDQQEEMLFEAQSHASLQKIKQDVLRAIANSSRLMPETGTQTGPLLATRDSSIPASLRQFIPESYDKLSWSRLTTSFRLAVLSQQKGGTQVALTRVKAGAHMPTHSHTGTEITLVLKGAFSDESGVYKEGDFICRGEKDTHRPVVTKNDECICLTALDAPIEFTGWFARWLNPLLKRHHPKTC